MPYPDGRIEMTDAEAVVCEARALERETIAETQQLLPPEPPWVGDEARYERLRQAAADVVAIAWAVQDPVAEDPYAPLGQAILADAQSVLRKVRDFAPDGLVAPAPPPPKT
jgi:hypothetical protein